jgi:hypothetical protein
MSLQFADDPRQACRWCCFCLLCVSREHSLSTRLSFSTALMMCSPAPGMHSFVACVFQISCSTDLQHAAATGGAASKASKTWADEVDEADGEQQRCMQPWHAAGHTFATLVLCDDHDGRAALSATCSSILGHVAFITTQPALAGDLDSCSTAACCAGMHARKLVCSRDAEPFAPVDLGAFRQPLLPPRTTLCQQMGGLC